MYLTYKYSFSYAQQRRVDLLCVCRIKMVYYVCGVRVKSTEMFWCSPETIGDIIKSCAGKRRTLGDGCL